MAWPSEAGHLGIIRAHSAPVKTAPGPRSRLFASAALRGKHYHSVRGRYRIFNSACYRFYHSTLGPPKPKKDGGDSFFATNSSLNYTPADTFGDGVHYFSVTRFNGIVESGFLPLGPNGETYLRLEVSGGSEIGRPPAAPLLARLEKAASGVIKVLAIYYETGDYRADDFAIAYTTDGSEPPEDSPDDTVAITGIGMQPLEYSLPGQAHGTTVKVRVQTRRNDGTDVSPVWVYSDDSEVLTETVDATGPSAPPSGDTWPGNIPEET